MHFVINKQDKEKQKSKKPKLKDTRGFYLGNHYADKPNIERKKSNICIHCPKCNTTFNSNFEFRIHIPQCNK
jgi:hypothetical protein